MENRQHLTGLALQRRLDACHRDVVRCCRRLELITEELAAEREHRPRMITSPAFVPVRPSWRQSRAY